MLYDPLTQLIGSSVALGIACAARRRSGSRLMTGIWSNMSVLSSIAVISACGSNAEALGGGPASKAAAWIANALFIVVNFPAILLLGGEEIVETHGPWLPTLVYLAALTLYSIMCSAGDALLARDQLPSRPVS